MKKSLKNTIFVLLIMITLVFFMFGSIIAPDDELSYSERRKLKQFPNFSFSTVVNGKFFTEIEDYFLDQFIFRDTFRKLNYIYKTNILLESDSNKAYVVDDVIYKQEYPLNESSLNNATDKINEVIKKYLDKMNIYYSIIPDKNYFAPNEYLKMDYVKFQKIISSNLNLNYINIFDLLEITDYYKTDIHFKQDMIIDVVNKLLKKMNNQLINSSDFTRKDLYPFYGSYYSLVNISSKDTLTYLNSEIIENMTVYDYEKQKEIDVYDETLFKGMDGYDVYLSGPKPLLTITNNNVDTNKELYLFRDSFGSSLAPLLATKYYKVHLIDLRYISTNAINNFIEFKENQDVLFIYSTVILNNSFTFK